MIFPSLYVCFDCALLPSAKGQSGHGRMLPFAGERKGKKQMIWMAEDPKARVAHSENNQIRKPWVSMQNLGYKVTPHEFCSSCFPGYIYTYIYPYGTKHCLKNLGILWRRPHFPIPRS